MTKAESLAVPVYIDEVSSIHPVSDALGFFKLMQRVLSFYFLYIAIVPCLDKAALAVVFISVEIDCFC